MKDFVYYTRLAVREDRNRLWRLGVLVFVVVIAVGLNYTGSGPATRAPLYAALAATALAAERMPVKPMSHYPIVGWRRRVNVVEIDRWTTALLSVMAGATALWAAGNWLLSTQAGLPYFILGAIIAIVGAFTLIQTLPGLNVRDDKGVDVQNGDDGE